jgi:hypothetical protein
MFVVLSQSPDRLLDISQQQQPSFSFFRPAIVCSKKGTIFMIRFSSYGANNYRTPSAQTYLDPLQVQYEELQKLRERVRKAEAAAAQGMKRRSCIMLALRPGVRKESHGGRR